MTSGCQAWGARYPAVQGTHAAGAAPILVVGTTGIRPPAEWPVLADQLESGQLLTWEGKRHGACTNLRGHGPCVTEAVTPTCSPAAPRKGLTCHGKE